MLHVYPKMMITSITKPNLLPSYSLSSPPPTCIHAVSCSSITKAKVLKQPQHSRRRNLSCCCEVTLKEEGVAPSPSSSSNGVDEELEKEATNAKIGARVRVKVPLKVYHVPKVPEIDLAGMEGVVRQYVALWKGKRISANFPYKVEFYTEVEGRGSVKFFAHLRDDEFEYLD